MVEGGESSCDLSFLRILMPGFSKKLPIPPAFVDRLRCSMEENISSGVSYKLVVNNLLDDDEYSCWHVDVYKEEENTEDHVFFYFGGEGLLKFALANRLGVGYFLVFRYRGNMTFTVSVFFGNGTVCYCLEKKKKNFKKFHKLEHKKITGGSCRVKKSSSRVKMMSNINICSSIIKGAGASFEATIKPSNLVTPYMAFPREFCESNGLTDVSDLILIDPEDRPWPVSFYHRRMKNRSSLSTGWLDFATANRLRVGYKCIFLLGSQEINHHQKVVIHVKILA